ERSRGISHLAGQDGPLVAPYRDAQGGPEAPGHDDQAQHPREPAGLEAPEQRPRCPREADRWQVERPFRDKHSDLDGKVRYREERDRDPAEPERFEPAAASPGEPEERGPRGDAQQPERDAGDDR